MKNLQFTLFLVICLASIAIIAVSANNKYEEVNERYFPDKGLISLGGRYER